MITLRRQQNLLPKDIIKIILKQVKLKTKSVQKYVCKVYAKICNSLYFFRNTLSK